MIRIPASAAAITGALLATALAATGNTAQPPVAVTSTAAGLAMLTCLWRRGRATPTDWLIAQALLAATLIVSALVNRRELGTFTAGALIAAASVFLLLAVLNRMLLRRRAAEIRERRRSP